MTASTRSNRTAGHHLDDVLHWAKCYWHLGVIGLLIVAYVIRAIHVAHFARVQIEDGTYPYTAVLVTQGLLPVRDFYNGLGVFWPYVYALPQALLGPGLFVGRMTSLAIMVGVIVLVGATAHRLSGRIGSVAAVSILTLNPISLHYLTSTYSYTLSVALILCAVVIAMKNPAGRATSLLAGLVMGLAVLTRVTAVVPLGLLLLTIACLNRPSRRASLHYLIGAASALAGGFGPLFVLSPTKFLFPLTSRLSMGQAFTFYASSDVNPMASKLRVLASLAANHYVDVCVLLLLALAITLHLIKVKTIFWSSAHVWWLGFLGASVIGVEAINLAPNVTSFEYYEMVAPLSAIVGGSLLGLAAARVKHAAKSVLLLVAVVMITSPLVVCHDKLVYASSPVAQVEAVGDYIAERVPEGAEILTFFMPIALEAGRNNPPNLTRGYFSFIPGMEAVQAERLGVMNAEQLTKIIAEQQPRAIALDQDYFYRRLEDQPTVVQAVMKSVTSAYYRAPQEFTITGIGQVTIYLPKDPSLESALTEATALGYIAALRDDVVEYYVQNGWDGNDRAAIIRAWLDMTTEQFVIDNDRDAKAVALALGWQP